MLRKVLLFIIVITFFLNSTCFAAQWSEILSLASQNNNELISAEKQMESSRWSYNRAYTSFFPSLSASVSMRETTSGTVSASSKSYFYGLNATQYLFKGMENIYSLELAYSNYEYYKANYINTKSNVYYEIREAFLDLLIAEQNVELLKKILEQRKENARLIKLKYESGKEDKGNLMRTEADQAEAEYNHSSAKRDLRLAKLKLSQLVGKEIDKAEGKIEVKSFERPDFEEFLKKTPFYIMAKYQLQSAEIEKKSAISGFLPSISLSANWNKTGDEWPPESDRSSWSLNLSYPFFTGGSNFIDPIIYDLKFKKAQEYFIKSAKDVRFGLEEAYEGFKDAIESLDVRKISLSAAEERAKIARTKYLNGLMSYDEWDRIESDYITAQKSILSSEKGALMTEALWHKAYGGWIR